MIFTAQPTMFIHKFSICISVAICFLDCISINSALPSTTNEIPQNDSNGNDYYNLLKRIDDQLQEKLTLLNKELGEGNRKLEALETQNADVQKAVEGFRNELSKVAGLATPANYQQLPTDKSDIGNLAKELKTVEKTLKNLNSDVTWVKKNLINIVNATGILALKQLFPSLAEAEDAPEESQFPRHCQDIKDSGENASGLYVVQPSLSEVPFTVLCDMDTHDGGWTYIHNRYDGSQDFYLNWDDYKVGFGNVAGEFWLGLEKIYQLIGYEVHELLVELVNKDGLEGYAHYAAFGIGPESEYYKLKVLGGYSGDAGDSLAYHAGNAFTTDDSDSDNWNSGNCATSRQGAWWYDNCAHSNLNGLYSGGLTRERMSWNDFGDDNVKITQARMLVRPRGPDSPPIFPDGLSAVRNA